VSSRRETVRTWGVHCVKGVISSRVYIYIYIQYYIVAAFRAALPAVFVYACVYIQYRVYGGDGCGGGNRRG